MLIRYHILRRDIRTTVSLDTTLSALMSLRLKTEPATPQAHLAIRDWIQQKVDELNDPWYRQLSQWVQSEIVLFLVDRKLSETYVDWCLSGEGECVYWRKRRRKARTALSPPNSEEG